MAGNRHIAFSTLLFGDYLSVKAMLSDLYINQNLGMEQIGLILGCDKSSVRYELNKEGIPIKHKGRPPFEKTVKKSAIPIIDNDAPLAALKQAELNILLRLVKVQLDKQKAVETISVKVLQIDNLYRYPGLKALLDAGLLKVVNKDNIQNQDIEKLKLRIMPKLISALSTCLKDNKSPEKSQGAADRKALEKEAKRLGLLNSSRNYIVDRSTEKKLCNNYERCLTICAIYDGNYIPCPNCNGTLPWPENWVNRTIAKLYEDAKPLDVVDKVFLPDEGRRPGVIKEIEDAPNEFRRSRYLEGIRITL